MWATHKACALPTVRWLWLLLGAERLQLAGRQGPRDKKGLWMRVEGPRGQLESSWAAGVHSCCVSCPGAAPFLPASTAPDQLPGSACSCPVSLYSPAGNFWLLLFLV